MATKKPVSKSKPKAAPPPQKGRLQNLAAKPTSFSDEPTMDDQLVDNSGVFRVTAAIQRDQIGHDDDDADPRFASDSLVMRAQQDGFRERGTALDEVTEEVAVDDEAAAALKRERLRALAARDLARRQRR
jgi:hypothetical protein